MKNIAKILCYVLLLSSTAALAGVQQDVALLAKDWAKANYQMKGAQQEEAFEVLIRQSSEAVKLHPASADLLIWQGIIKSSFAGVKGGLSALSLIKEAKTDLEQSILLDDKALSGSAHTTLGALYFKAPGWPISFGDDEQAKRYLQKGLSLDPNGIDSHYFYALFLVDQGEKKQAQASFMKALDAKARAGREVADIGRRNEINEALHEIK